MSGDITNAIGTVTSSIGETINVGSIAAIIGAVLGSALVLYLAWFGIRKVISVTKGALKGKLKV